MGNRHSNIPVMLMETVQTSDGDPNKTNTGFPQPLPSENSGPFSQSSICTNGPIVSLLSRTFLFLCVHTLPTKFVVHWLFVQGLQTSDRLSITSKKERKKKVQLASASSYHPIIFFPYHQPFLKERATHIVSTATLSKSSMPSVFFSAPSFSWNQLHFSQRLSGWYLCSKRNTVYRSKVKSHCTLQ